MSRPQKLFAALYRYSREEACKLTCSLKYHAPSSIHDSYFREEA